MKEYLIAINKLFVASFFRYTCKDILCIKDIVMLATWDPIKSSKSDCHHDHYKWSTSVYQVTCKRNSWRDEKKNGLHLDWQLSKEWVSQNNGRNVHIHDINLFLSLGISCIFFPFFLLFIHSHFITPSNEIYLQFKHLIMFIDPYSCQSNYLG